MNECEKCQHITECIEEFGPYRDDDDDYRAVVGTHFCRQSWDKFYEDMKKRKKQVDIEKNV